MSGQPFQFTRYAEVHASPAGPGDGRPTAMQIIKDNKLEGGLKDKTILITGASNGIGAETARALAATGARIFMGVRNPERAQKVLADIESTTPISKGRLELVEMDLNSLESVRKAAADVLKRTEQLNILVNNAGISHQPKTTTVDGFDQIMQVNWAAHFLLFKLLQPLLLSSSTPVFHSRLVNVSSLAHRFDGPLDFSDLDFTVRPYNTNNVYAGSKLASNWTANEIERRYGAAGLHGFALHPGAINTDMVTQNQDPEFRKWLESVMALPGAKEAFKSVEQGAATTVLAAVEKDLEGKGGIFLEDCGTYGQFDPATGALFDRGHASWNFDADGARKLWTVACERLGVKED